MSSAHRAMNPMIMKSYFLRLSAPLTIFVLVASAWFANVDARATVQSKRSSMQQQQLQGWDKKWAPGCESFSGEFWSKWKATA